MASAGGGNQPASFELLDGLRGLGAVLVIVGHTAPFWGMQYVTTGAVCVDIFFLISGYVIAFSYEPKFATGMKAPTFMLHRFVRLYPLYLLGVLMCAVVAFASVMNDPDGGGRALDQTVQVLLQLFMLPTPAFTGTENLYALNAPAWTLFFELLANLAYVLVWPLLTTRVLWGVVVVLAGALAWSVFAHNGIDNGADWSTFVGGLARGFFGFFAGVLVFRIAGSPASPGVQRRSWIVPVLVLLPLLLVVPVPEALRPHYEIFLVLGVGMPLLFVVQYFQPNAAFSRAFTVIGRISYAMYILHWAFLDVLLRVSWRYPDLYGNLAPWTGVALLAVVAAVSYFAERYFDRPVRRWIVAMLKARSQRNRSSAVTVGGMANPG